MMMLHITRLVRDTVEVKSGPEGASLGVLIDDYLAEAAINGSAVHEISFSIPPDDWHDINRAMRSQFAAHNSLDESWVSLNAPPPGNSVGLESGSKNPKAKAASRGY